MWLSSEREVRFSFFFFKDFLRPKNKDVSGGTKTGCEVRSVMATKLEAVAQVRKVRPRRACPLVITLALAGGGGNQEAIVGRTASGERT